MIYLFSYFFILIVIHFILKTIIPTIGIRFAFVVIIIVYIPRITGRPFFLVATNKQPISITVFCNN